MQDERLLNRKSVRQGNKKSDANSDQQQGHAHLFIQRRKEGQQPEQGIEDRARRKREASSTYINECVFQWSPPRRKYSRNDLA